MEARVSLTRKDMLILSVYSLHQYIIVIFFMMWVAESWNYILYTHLSFVNILKYSAVNAIIPTLVLVLFFTLQRMSKGQQKTGILGKHKFRIDETGIYQKSRFINSFYKWQSFKNIKISGGYGLMVLHNGGMLILAKRDFASPEAFEQFVALAREYLQQSRDNTEQ